VACAELSLDGSDVCCTGGGAFVGAADVVVLDELSVDEEDTGALVEGVICELLEGLLEDVTVPDE
jgi:hypothetical protein